VIFVGSGEVIQEIVVSAQKKGEERLLDVPVPVTVLNTDKLTENNEVLLRDYAATVPGLSLQADIVGLQEASIRGITTGGNAVPVIGILVDDVPFGSSTSFLGGNALPDIDPGDLARIEVLRGPQGTLYGANSMGGLIKYVMKDPDTHTYSGRVEAGYSSVDHGAEPGFNIRASANIPLSDTLAIRVSGYERQDPGYIDNPVLGARQALMNADGGRMSARWLPTDSVSLKITAMYQHYRQNAANDEVVAPGLGRWQQNYIADYGGRDQRTIQAYSADLKVNLGNVDLTSITGYNA
jgi:iron complex outermembrane receptor protein